MPLETVLITEIEELERLSERWRELAHACSCPAALPGWQLAWWRHLAPRGALLRAVAVFDDDRLVGLAPFFVNPGRRVDYRLLGAGITHRLSPLAAPGREREIASLVVDALAGASPRPDLIAFEGIDAGSPWPQAFVDSWPGKLRPWRYVTSTHPAPVLELRGSFEEWLATRSSNFRQQIARARRAIEAKGGSIHLALESTEIERALDAFADLHLQRWKKRGGSSLDEDVFALLEEGAHDLVERGEMRLWVIELGGKVVCVAIFLTAGGEILFFNSGFDESHGDLKPGLVALFAAVEDAFARGSRKFDFGGGATSYKLRFTSGDAPIHWIGIVPRSRRYLLTRARLAPQQWGSFVRRLSRRFLSPRQRTRIKRLLSRD